MEQLLNGLRAMSLGQAFWLLLVQNILVFLLSVAFGHLLVRCFSSRPVAHAPQPLEAIEILLTISTVLINTAVTLAGFRLWQTGVINFRTDVGWWALLDVLLLLFVMDIAMYVLHRIAHHKWLFPLLHSTHHRFDKPRPLTLFVLNPFETLSFGLLWLAVVSFYDASWLGMSIYLALNVFFGTVGHLGVEPLPDRWKRLTILNYLSTSTFHAQHHADRDHNFGFYTLIWDRLCGTLSPTYEEDFGRLPLQRATPDSSA